MSGQFLKTREETQAWLDQMRIRRYVIRDDLTVDVKGSVNISRKGLDIIPIQFGVVSSDFYCDNNQLVSLNGLPRVCKGLWCDMNQLVSLAGAPTKCNLFNCSNNQLTSLEGSPSVVFSFWCGGNRLTNLNGMPNQCAILGCQGNPLLTDISAAPIGCDLKYDRDVVARNQAARHLDALGVVRAGSGVLRSKTGRVL